MIILYYQIKTSIDFLRRWDILFNNNRFYKMN